LTAMHSAILDTVDKRQTEEREALMDLIQAAKGNNSVIKAAKKMDQQELKTKLTKLEQDHKNWRKKSQQVALSVSEQNMSKKEKVKFYKGVAERRKEQDKLLAEAMVYRMELEQQMGSKTDDDIAVTLLSNLQEKQESENRAISTLLSSQEEAALTQIKNLQRVGKREGWFDNLTAMVFSMSSAGEGVADDDHELQMMEKMKQDTDRQMEQEKENLLSEAKERSHSEEEVKAALQQLEWEQENKRKRMEDDMSAQRKKILERVAARKKQDTDKETEQLTAMQLVMVAESQQKQQQEAIAREKSHQGSELQKRLEARRLARKRSVEDNKGQENAESQDKPSSSSSSRTVDSNFIDNVLLEQNPFAAMKREKTVLNVELTDKERDDELKKLHREQFNLRSRIQDQQKQQEEMLQRRLKQRQNKKELEAQQLLSLGERQKTQLLNVKQTSGVQVDDDCIHRYADLQKHHKLKYLTFKLSEDAKKIVVDKVGQLGASYDDFVEELKNAGRDGEGRYAVFDFEYNVRGQVAAKIVFFLWVPDGIKVKQRMLYSSSVKALKQKLNGIHIEMQCNDECDLAQSEILQKCTERGYD
ncbi:hypothetical protein FSP39_018604, partial [Pinctada imbricata]